MRPRVGLRTSLAHGLVPVMFLFLVFCAESLKAFDRQRAGTGELDTGSFSAEDSLPRRHTPDDLLVMYPLSVELLPTGAARMRVSFSDGPGGSCLAGVVYLARVLMTQLATGVTTTLHHAFDTNNLTHASLFLMLPSDLPAGDYWAQVTVLDTHHMLTEDEAFLAKRDTLMHVPRSATAHTNLRSLEVGGKDDARITDGEGREGKEGRAGEGDEEDLQSGQDVDPRTRIDEDSATRLERHTDTGKGVGARERGRGAGGEREAEGGRGRGRERER